jgi:hypothetical protein
MYVIITGGQIKMDLERILLIIFGFIYFMTIRVMKYKLQKAELMIEQLREEFQHKERMQKRAYDFVGGDIIPVRSLDSGMVINARVEQGANILPHAILTTNENGEVKPYDENEMDGAVIERRPKFMAEQAYQGY